jgi:hypothetical protein
MIGIPRNVHIARFPIDLRFGINRLWALARDAGLSPENGDVVVFSGRNRKRLKVLHADLTGIWLSVKIFSSEEARSRVGFLDNVELTAVSPADLVLLLEGMVDLECLKK